MALSKILENSITDGVVSSAKLKDFSAAVDLNGVELILDADQDTSITADTDDRIDFKIANVEHFSFSNSSGDTVVKPMVDAKDIIFQQYDGNKILEINDGNYVGIGGNAAGAGEIRIYEDTDNGTHYTGFKAGNNTASVAYVLPTADGSSGHALQTDGSGTLSWGAAGAITTYSNSTNNRVITSVDSTSVNSEANLTFDGSTLAVTGAVTVSTNLDVDGTANLDAVDIDGAVQLDATLTVGANDQGYDVILYGDTASANMTWDTSVDDLIFNGAARIVVPDGQLVLGSTAVTSTAAELNLLDGVSGLVQADLTKLAAVDSTAAELNIVDGGTSATGTTVADADRVVMNDNGTMVQVAVTDLAAYFDDEITAMPNLTSVGTLTALTVDDVAIDGKVMTMTGSSGDTFVTTVAANGATSLVTTDASAAAANLTITADGTVGINSTGDMTLDSSADIILDADGADIVFKDGGTTIATHSNSSSDYVITTGVQDKDFVIKGDDGGSAITPLTIDMSAGGDLFLTGGLIDLKNDGSNVSQIKFYCEASNAHAQTLIGAPHSESATNTLTLPSTGGNSYLVTAASTATLTNKTLTAPVINTATVGTSITPASDDGATLGSANLNWSDLYLADSAEIFFGDDQDFSLKQVGDGELSFKRNATSDDSYPALFFDTGETDIAINDILGAIHFRAPDEAAGTDAILTGASIVAKSEGDFSASNNATSIQLRTAASGAVTNKVTIKSHGDVHIDEGDLVFGTSGKGVVLGATSNTDANTLDDYEEGTHVTDADDITSGSITINGSQNTFSYTKIGRQVTITGEINVSSVSSPSTMRLSLPFTIAANTVDRNNSFGFKPSSYHVPYVAGETPQAIGEQNTSYISILRTTDDGAHAAYTAVAGESWWFNFSYFT